MKKITTFFTMALLTMFSWQGMAQNGGDTCADAVVVTPGVFADAEISNMAGGATDGGATNAIWYSYTPTGDGTIDVGSCMSDPAGVDTRLRIHDGDCATLNQVDFDDDGCDAPNTFGSLLSGVPVTAGTAYFIEWDDRWETAPFDWELSFTPAPTGDTCAEALPVDPGVFLDVQINDATVGTNNGDALWYVYTAAESGVITVDSGIDLDTPDTRVFIYDNCTDLTVLDSDDDSGPGFTSLIEDFPVVAGTSYIIAFDDRWSIDPFDWELSFSSCLSPTAFVATATQTEAVFTWTDSADAVNGNTLEVFLAGADPMVDTPIDTQIISAGIETATTTGLTDTTSYDAYLTGDCDTSVSDALMITFSTAPAPPVCGGQFFDTGGPDNDFMNNEDYQVTISPDNPGDVVTATFTFVDNAGGTFDTLTVDVGDGIFQLVPDVDAGEAPAIFSSIAADGSLLFNFESSGVAPNPGWEADITCGPAPTCLPVTNVVVSAISDTEATISWDEVATATNGYIFELFLDGADPMTDTPVDTQTVAAGTLSVMVTGLMELIEYDAYVTSDCGDTNGLSTVNGPISFTTTASPGPNATCDTALVIGPGLFTGQIIDANPGTNNGDSLWYSFTPGTDGDITITSCVSGADTRVFLSEGPCDALTAIADNDDSCGLSSLIEDVPVTAGTQYLIQWDDRWETDEFDWELIFNSNGPPPCDAPQNFTVSNVLDTTADLTWDMAPTANDGYQTFIFLEGQDPQVDTPVYTSGIIPQGTFADTATGLNPEIAYDAYIASLCDLTLDPVLTMLSSDPITFNTVLGIQDSNLVSYVIYPNPASDNINLSAAFGIENIVVSNILGQQVLTNNGGSQELTLDIAGLQTGTYFIKATVNGIDVVEKFIKK